jgi:hypothetical protein
MNTIIYDNYKFEIELSESQININLTKTDLLDVYKGFVNEADIYVKPIKKFYLMIGKALNKEPNYNIIITEKKGQMICSFSYNNEMIDIEETITCTKVNSDKTKELLLVKRVKELEDMLTPIFGFNTETGENIKFDINSTVLDFRPFNIDEKNLTKFKLFNTSVFEFNKFKNVKKIIYNHILSPVYMTSEDFHIEYKPPVYMTLNGIYKQYKPIESHQRRSHFNNQPQSYIPIFSGYCKFLSMPSVIEIEVYLNKNSNAGVLASYPCFQNLRKISVINIDFTDNFTAEDLIIHPQQSYQGF